MQNTLSVFIRTNSYKNLSSQINYKLENGNVALMTNASFPQLHIEEKIQILRAINTGEIDKKAFNKQIKDKTDQRIDMEKFIEMVDMVASHPDNVKQFKHINDLPRSKKVNKNGVVMKTAISVTGFFVSLV